MTQGEIERMPAGIAKAFQELEQRIMNDIIRRIKINNFSTASADWQITRLQQLGESEENIRKWTKSALDLSDMELSLVFNDGVYKEYMKHERAYQVNGMKQIPYADNHTLKQLVAAIERQTKGELENITQNKAVAVAGPGGQILAKPLMDFYRDTLDRASLDIQSGAFDYQSVLMRTVKELKNSGIRSIAYGGNRSDRVDVAVRRAVLTGFRQVQEKINEQTAAELGTDFYEVSYHVGARPTHQPWQGRVYSWQDLHDVCGLGTVTGLHGANCYHDYNPFVPGASVRTYTDEQLDRMIEEENTPKEYQGKAYTTYTALQEQRRLERNARALREAVDMLQEGEADPESVSLIKARYHGILQQYEDFSSRMDLPMQHERIFLDGLKVDMRIPKAVEKETASAIIKLPDVSGCQYRTEKEYKALAKAHAKGAERADIKQITKHTKQDGSQGGYVATRNYQTINRALMENNYDSLSADDKETVEAMRRVISGNQLDQDSVLTRYVNADYISSVFGTRNENGEILGNMELECRKKVMQAAVEDVRKKIGTMVSNNAFISTSMIKEKNIMQDKSVRITISAVKGTHCYVPTNRKESEVIFGDNTDLYITDAKTAVDGKLEIFAILLEREK